MKNRIKGLSDTFLSQSQTTKLTKNQSKLTMQCSRDIISKSLQRSRLILKCNPRSVCFDLQTTHTHAWCH